MAVVEDLFKATVAWFCGSAHNLPNDRNMPILLFELTTDEPRKLIEAICTPKGEVKHLDAH